MKIYILFLLAVIAVADREIFSRSYYKFKGPLPGTEGGPISTFPYWNNSNTVIHISDCATKCNSESLCNYFCIAQGQCALYSNYLLPFASGYPTSGRTYDTCYLSPVEYVENIFRSSMPVTGSMANNLIIDGLAYSTGSSRLMTYIMAYPYFTIDMGNIYAIREVQVYLYRNDGVYDSRNTVFLLGNSSSYTDNPSISFAPWTPTDPAGKFIKIFTNPNISGRYFTHFCNHTSASICISEIVAFPALN